MSTVRNAASAIDSERAIEKYGQAELRGILVRLSCPYPVNVTTRVYCSDSLKTQGIVKSTAAVARGHVPHANLRTRTISIKLRPEGLDQPEVRTAV